jgi:hypothetical protein
MRKTVLTIIAVCLVAAIFLSAPATNLAAKKKTRLPRVNPENRYPQIKPSTLIEDLQTRQLTNTKLTAKQLADYGNELIKKKGFNYYFEMCEVIKANKNPKNIGSEVSPSLLYSYNLNLIDGEKQKFQFITPDTSGSCGECLMTIPVTSVSKNEISLLASGKEYKVKRVPRFTLNEMVLMDKKMKRVLRRWETPYQDSPVGVSADGLNLYLESGIEGLLLEVSESGLQFKAKSQVKLQGKGVSLDNHPVGPKNDSLYFMKFRVGKKSFIIRYLMEDCC